jgi:hypothetical protein
MILQDIRARLANEKTIFCSGGQKTIFSKRVSKYSFFMTRLADHYFCTFALYFHGAFGRPIFCNYIFIPGEK